jgi:hypothetical protein
MWIPGVNPVIVPAIIPITKKIIICNNISEKKFEIIKKEIKKRG